MRSPPRTIVIVGGGFCGTVLAANLLRRPPAEPTRVVLLERRASVGCGVAYQRGQYPYLLNVPAGRMSADIGDPAQFVRFAQRHCAHVTAEDFLPRQLYGEYLQDVLKCAERAAPSHITVEHIQGQAHELHRIEAGRLLVGLSHQQHLLADNVVLACGDPPPASPAFVAGVEEHTAYVRDPFSDAAFRPETQRLLLIGTGLTMVDAAVTAAALNPQIQIHAISRHGLLPATQSSLTPTALNAELAPPLQQGPIHARQVLRAFRSLLQQVERLGGNWHDAVTVMRHAVPGVWQRLAIVERQRFLRHLRTRWDAHRHRLPPAMAQRLAALRRSGQLHIHAGHIEDVQGTAAGLRVRWRPRGTTDAVQLQFDRVVNCTGTDRRLAHTRDPLLRGLLDQGIATADPLGLGLLTDQHGALVDREGRADGHLHYLGPMLRSVHFEATAVGELRVHAQRLATTLAQVSTPVREHCHDHLSRTTHASHPSLAPA